MLQHYQCLLVVQHSMSGTEAFPLYNIPCCKDVGTCSCVCSASLRSRFNSTHTYQHSTKRHVGQLDSSCDMP